MFGSIIYFLRQYAIFRFLWKMIRNFWPLILILVFWPEISRFMSRFELWRICMERMKIFWVELTHTEIWLDVTGFLSDSLHWMIREIRPSLTVIGDFVSGIFV